MSAALRNGAHNNTLLLTDNCACMNAVSDDDRVAMQSMKFASAESAGTGPAAAPSAPRAARLLIMKNR